MAYPELSDLLEQSTVPELLELETAEQEALYALAQSAIEQHTGQSFVPSTDDVRMDGSGSDELYPPIRVEELDAITVAGAELDVTDVEVLDDGMRILMKPPNLSYAVQATRIADSRTFRAGSGTITLEGTFGWAECPAAVVQALRIDMEDQAQADASKLSGIVASSRKLGIRDISQGNLRVTLGSPETVSPRVARLLARYVFPARPGYLH